MAELTFGIDSIDKLEAVIRAVLASGKPALIPVDGRCMRPAFEPGDVLVVADAEPVSAQVGQVWVLREGDLLVAHRIISRGTDNGGFYVVSQGDHGLQPGPRVYGQGMLGRVIGVRTAGGPRAARSGRSGDIGSVAALAALAAALHWQSWHRPAPSTGGTPAEARRPVAGFSHSFLGSAPTAAGQGRTIAASGMVRWAADASALRLTQCTTLALAGTVLYCLSRRIGMARWQSLATAALACISGPVAGLSLSARSLGALSLLPVTLATLLAVPRDLMGLVPGPVPKWRPLLRVGAVLGLGALATTVGPEAAATAGVAWSAAAADSLGMRPYWGAVAVALTALLAWGHALTYRAEWHLLFPALRSLWPAGGLLLGVAVGWVVAARAGAPRWAGPKRTGNAAQRKVERQTMIVMGGWLTTAMMLLVAVQPQSLALTAAALVVYSSYLIRLTAYRCRRTKMRFGIYVALAAAVVSAGQNLQAMPWYRRPCGRGSRYAEVAAGAAGHPPSAHRMTDRGAPLLSGQGAGAGGAGRGQPQPALHRTGPGEPRTGARVRE